MTYELYMLVCYIGAGLSALMLLVSIILFFALNIVKVFRDLKSVNPESDILTNRNDTAESDSGFQNETMMLNMDSPAEKSIYSETDSKVFDGFSIEQDITIINTDERID